MLKIFTILVLFASTVFAADNQPTATDAKMQAEMKKWMEAGTPGTNHKVITEMAGEWKYTTKMWMTPAAKADESGSGTSNNKMILGGRYLQQDVKGTGMGQPFEGMGMLGYDNVKGKFVSTWMDSMGTGIIYSADGSYDNRTKTLKDTGEFSDPTKAAKKTAFRSETKILDKNTYTFAMFLKGDDGKEFKHMEMTYKKVTK